MCLWSTGTSKRPGLHRYFHPFLRDKNLTSSEGVIDLVMQFEDAAINGSTRSEKERDGPDKDWYRPLADITKYTIPLAYSFDGGGLLDLLPAGKQGPSYAQRVNSFSWPRFYDRLGGGVFLEAVKQSMRKTYEYILIDSRTGVSDSAGISIVQMPDTLVVCFTLNIQSMAGAAAVTTSVCEERKRFSSAVRKKNELRIFPVPMRVETAEKIRLDRARESAADSFAAFIEHLPSEKRSQYWKKMNVPYVPFYAYEEILATLADTSGLTNSLLDSLETLTGYLTNGTVDAVGPMDDSKREQLKQLYLEGVKSQSVSSVLEQHPELGSLYLTVSSKQSAWKETDGKEAHLLDSSSISEVRNNSKFLVALMQDSAFREFWNASQQDIARRHLFRWLLIHLMVILASSSSLTVFLTLNTIWDKYLIVPISGSLGAALASLLREMSSIGSSITTPESKREKRFIIELLNGALLALTLIILTGISNPYTPYLVSTEFGLIPLGMLIGIFSTWLIKILFKPPWGDSSTNRS